MNLKEILQAKGTKVHTIDPSATLDDAVDELVRHNVGSLLVCDSASDMARSSVIGIITERDILRAQAAHKVPLEQRRISEVMSTDLVTASPEDGIERAMHLMTYRRVRHLPVVFEGEVCGIVSIGDIVKAHHDELAIENHFMKSYIQGEGAQ